ncbi:MAG: Cell division integral membrane protein, YggT and half-length relatives, partial [uncultured Sphingomonas sp.]
CFLPFSVCWTCCCGCSAGSSSCRSCCRGWWRSTSSTLRRTACGASSVRSTGCSIRSTGRSARSCRTSAGSTCRPSYCCSPSRSCGCCLAASLRTWPTRG